MLLRRILTTKSEMLPLQPLLVQLNPNLLPERYELLLDDMLKCGYRMLVLYDQERPIAVTGIWVATKFYSGRYMELDNVVVDQEYRQQGIGQELCAWAEEIALAEGCEMLMLDAYRENTVAHQFYHKQGYIKRGFHFLKPISGWAVTHPPLLPPDIEP
jgi:GNAT superfamily N-acetyltransferase